MLKVLPSASTFILDFLAGASLSSVYTLSISVRMCLHSNFEGLFARRLCSNLQSIEAEAEARTLQ